MYLSPKVYVIMTKAWVIVVKKAKWIIDKKIHFADLEKNAN